MARHSSRRVPQRLIIMVKEPRMGAVKTRLAREVGAVAALRFYRSVTVNLIRRLAFDPRWETVLAVAPDSTVRNGCWPAGTRHVPQGDGDLGARMERLLLASGACRSVLIGSDIPSVRAVHIAGAFRVLAGRDAVFGPAEDGGFWLVGLKRLPRIAGLFDGVRWSSFHALADTLGNIAPREAGCAATLSDVDNLRDYEMAGSMGACVTLPSRRGGEGFTLLRENPARSAT